MPYQFDDMHSFVNALNADELKLLIEEIERRKVTEEFGYPTLSDYALSLGRMPRCPKCGSTEYQSFGIAACGERRYRCRPCGRTYTLLCNTIFNSTKKSFYDWFRFIRLMEYSPSLELIENTLDLDHKTAFLWRHKVFSTVNGYQDRTVLSGKVWLDEIYIEDISLTRPSGLKNRGLSRYKRCIVIGIDSYKNIVVREAGNGKISSARLLRAIGSNIRKGSTIVHDGEHSHDELVRRLQLVDECHTADVRNGEYLASMELVNSLSSWIKRYLFRHVGMKMSNLQSYLNWFAYLFRVKENDDKYPKTKRIIRHLLLNDGKFKRKSGH